MQDTPGKAASFTSAHPMVEPCQRVGDEGLRDFAFERGGFHQKVFADAGVDGVIAASQEMLCPR